MDRGCSRREFLKKFAALSSAPLLLGISGCGESDPVRIEASYGPPPFVDPMVYNICYLDGNTQVELYDHPSVPIDKKFILNFTAQMDVSAAAVVTLTQGSNDVVLDAPIWETASQLSVMPSAVLLNNMDYTLRLIDATDASGKKVIINANAAAAFKTIAA